MRDAIMNRISTRTFIKEELTTKEIKEIKGVVEKYKEVKGPFGNSFEITFNLNTKDKDKGHKIGTYGFIKNAPAFIGGVSLDGRNHIIDFGYILEKIVLELTKLGYDTCWLGGTFKRSSFRKQLEPNEVIPALIAVGHRADKRSWIDRTLRGVAQSQKRLPFETLFQYFDVEEALEEKEDSRFVDLMHLIRRGPSASNKQPWRFYVTNDHDVVYVYLKRTEGYGLALGYDIQALDAGISLAHLEVGLDYYNFTYERITETEGVFFDGLDYIITYKRAKGE